MTETEIINANLAAQAKLMRERAETLYWPTFAVPSDADESLANSVAAEQEHGEQSLQAIALACRELGVSAELRDEAGFLKGRVRSDGCWTLS